MHDGMAQPYFCKNGRSMFSWDLFLLLKYEKKEFYEAYHKKLLYMIDWMPPLCEGSSVRHIFVLIHV
jgi:hypothetical protein